MSICRDAVTGGPSRSTQKKKAEQFWKQELIPLTVPEVRVLVWQLVWHEVPPTDFVLNWSRWRRQHQAQAQRCYYPRHRTRAG